MEKVDRFAKSKKEFKPTISRKILFCSVINYPKKNQRK